MRFWISWYQPTTDARPVYDPEKESEPFEHRYWCSGERTDPFAHTMCAVVDAVSETEAFRLVQKYWSEAEELRFCEAKADNWLPDSGRFPLAQKERRSMGSEEIARVCHEVNRAYCQALGDNSQPAWEDAPQWQKDSALNGVKLHLENHNAGPEASHESWMKEKLAAGWTYGPKKDPEAKRHPCLVPFSELDTAQRAKDYIFRAVVRALFRSKGKNK